MDCTPQALMDAARCFRCIPKGMLGDVMTKLACEWANATPVPTGCGVPSTVIELIGSGMPNANQPYEQINAIQWRGLTDPTWVIELFGGVWTVVCIDEPDQYITLEGDFPCTWTVLPTGTGPAPSGIYAVTDIVIEDELGGFWQLVADQLGNIGATPVAGPATADVVLDDGFGGFWKVVVDSGGNRGTEPHVGPATLVTAIDDGTGTFWTLIVDTLGNLGATS